MSVTPAVFRSESSEAPASHSLRQAHQPSARDPSLPVTVCRSIYLQLPPHWIELSPACHYKQRLKFLAAAVTEPVFTVFLSLGTYTDAFRTAFSKGAWTETPQRALFKKKVLNIPRCFRIPWPEPSCGRFVLRLGSLSAASSSRFLVPRGGMETEQYWMRIQVSN